MNLPPARLTSRRHLLKWLCAAAICTPAIPLLGLENENEKLRGDRVGWARLKTQSEWWMRHANGDLTLTRFLRQETSLNIDLPWYVADVHKLDEMCRYPLLFAQSLTPVTEAADKKNVAEYMKRGGFMLVDACCNREIIPDHDAFLAQHIAYLREVVPMAKVLQLPPEHPVYSCHFQIAGNHPPHSFFRNIFDAHKARHGLYGVSIGDRMIGMISLSGLQCGWSPLGIDPPPGHLEACMKMLVNIYMYAMLQKE